MKHVKTLNTRKLQNTVKKGGCGECQTSCQSCGHLYVIEMCNDCTYYEEKMIESEEIL